MKIIAMQLHRFIYSTSCLCLLKLINCKMRLKRKMKFKLRELKLFICSVECFVILWEEVKRFV